MNRERLELLIDVLSTAQRGTFDMRTWCDVNVHADTSCGTTACALGWAALDPRFQKEGLRMLVQHSYDEDSYATPETVGALQDLARSDPMCVIIPATWNGGTRVVGEQAAMAFFDLSSDAAVYLFSPGGYKLNATPIDVINHIENLLQHGEDLFNERNATDRR